MKNNRFLKIAMIDNRISCRQYFIYFYQKPMWNILQFRCRNKGSGDQRMPAP